MAAAAGARSAACSCAKLRRASARLATGQAPAQSLLLRRQSPNAPPSNSSLTGPLSLVILVAGQSQALRTPASHKERLLALALETPELHRSELRSPALQPAKQVRF